MIGQEVAITTGKRVLTIPEDFSQIRQTWIKSKEEELVKAEQALVALSATDATDRRIRRTKERINLLKRVVHALKSGYVLIPRFNSDKLTMDMEELPLGAITAIDEAKAQHLFDEFRLIRGNLPEYRRGNMGRRPQRDPLIVGVVRTPGIVVDTWDDGRIRDQWMLEEHFLIAWWRPEDENMESMF